MFIEANKTKYYACVLAFYSKDLSEQMDILEDVMDIIAAESEKPETTEVLPIPDDEVMVSFLLEPLIHAYPEIGDQIRILEGFQSRMSESLGFEQTELIAEDSKLDRLWVAWCCLESDSGERHKFFREALMRLCSVDCWP